jgi:hypothetical protein
MNGFYPFKKKAGELVLHLHFTVTSNDGFRLYMDGQLKRDKWFDQGPTSYIVTVPLMSGKHTIMMEYYERSGEAVAKLLWQPANAKRLSKSEGEKDFHR